MKWGLRWRKVNIGVRLFLLPPLFLLLVFFDLSSDFIDSYIIIFIFIINYQIFVVYYHIFIVYYYIFIYINISLNSIHWLISWLEVRMGSLYGLINVRDTSRLVSSPLEVGMWSLDRLINIWDTPGLISFPNDHNSSFILTNTRLCFISIMGT